MFRRNNNQPIKLTDSMLQARWLERECIRLKKLGLSYANIADLLIRAARGEKGTGVNLPDPELLVLAPNYTVTTMSCCRAVKRALNREPAMEAEEYRQIDTARLEEWLLSLAAELRNGNPEAIRIALGLLKHKADLNGYAKVQPRQEVPAVGLQIMINTAPRADWSGGGPYVEIGTNGDRK